MQNNISNAEAALNIAHEGQLMSADQQTATATVAIAQAVVAIAKGVGVIGAIAYLAYRSNRSRVTTSPTSVNRSHVPTDPTNVKLDDMIQEGLGL